MTVTEICDATLEQAHGTSRCELPAGHEGKHEGSCWLCEEDGDYPVLTWNEQHEKWPLV